VAFTLLNNNAVFCTMSSATTQLQLNIDNAIGVEPVLVPYHAASAPSLSWADWLDGPAEGASAGGGSAAGGRSGGAACRATSTHRSIRGCREMRAGTLALPLAALDVMHGGRAMMRLAAHRYTRRYISRVVLCEGFLIG